MRVGIFCFYDSQGKVDEYIEYLLLQLKKVIDELYVVVNGNVDDNGRKIFLKYTEKLYIRENIGFDAGAYKDVIINLVGVSKIKEFDELVLCNDTFFGPFIDFNEIFAEMNKKRVDFWGLKYVEDSFLSHLQSYFLVFGKKILEEDILFQYFQDKVDISAENISDIYAIFERGLFYELKKAGYSYSAYANSINCDNYRSGNYAIKLEGLPLLKKKVFDKKYFVNDNVADALEIIKENYDISLIESVVKRKYQNIVIEKSKNRKNILYTFPIMKVTEYRVIDFVNSVKRIYIYGTGVVGTGIYYFLKNKDVLVDGFIISDGERKEKEWKNRIKIYFVSEVQFNKDDGVIIALNPENTNQIRNSIEKRGIEDILYLWDES